MYYDRLTIMKITEEKFHDCIINIQMLAQYIMWPLLVEMPVLIGLNI